MASARFHVRLDKGEPRDLLTILLAKFDRGEDILRGSSRVADETRHS